MPRCKKIDAYKLVITASGMNYRIVLRPSAAEMNLSLKLISGDPANQNICDL